MEISRDADDPWTMGKTTVAKSFKPRRVAKCDLKGYSRGKDK